MNALANKPTNRAEVLRRAIALHLDEIVGGKPVTGTFDDMVERIAAAAERIIASPDPLRPVTLAEATDPSFDEFRREGGKFGE